MAAAGLAALQGQLQQALRVHRGVLQRWLPGSSSGSTPAPPASAAASQREAFVAWASSRRGLLVIGSAAALTAAAAAALYYSSSRRRSDAGAELAAEQRATRPQQQQPAQAPPAAASSNDDTKRMLEVLEAMVHTLVVAPEQHISVDLAEVVACLVDRLPLCQQREFEALAKLLEGVTDVDFYGLKKRMRNNYLPFASGATNTTFLTRSNKCLPTTRLLDGREDAFIADLYEVLRASHYTLLTKEEWALALHENFNLNLPVQVNWQYMDADLLAKFWASSPERRAIRDALPDCMADRILVFHRGVGTERLEGLLMGHKAGLLAAYLAKAAHACLLAPLAALAARLRALLTGAPLPDPEEGASYLRRLLASGRSFSGTSAATSVAARQASGHSAALEHYQLSERGALVASHHRFAKTVERVTLARQCPTLLTLLKALPARIALVEPTYKQIVVVYRRALPPRVPPTAASQGVQKSKAERLQRLLAYRNIHVKVFGETAMADVEMVFPEKRVSSMPLQLAHLGATLAGALLAGAVVLWKAHRGSPLSPSVLWLLGGLFVTRGVGVAHSVVTERQRVQQHMTAALFEKMLHSQEGVLSVILEEMASQQVMQMLLAYGLLLLRDGPMRADALDTACEDFLYKEFDQQVDFDLDAALPRLLSWRLVSVNEQGKLEALPLADALAALQHAWATAHDALAGASSGPPAATLDLITGTHSMFNDAIGTFLEQRQQALAVPEGAPGKAAAATAAAGEQQARSGSAMRRASDKARGALGRLGRHAKDADAGNKGEDGAASAASSSAGAPPTPQGIAAAAPCSPDAAAAAGEGGSPFRNSAADDPALHARDQDTPAAAEPVPATAAEPAAAAAAAAPAGLLPAPPPPPLLVDVPAAAGPPGHESGSAPPSPYYSAPPSPYSAPASPYSAPPSPYSAPASPCSPAAEGNGSMKKRKSLKQVLSKLKHSVTDKQ